MKFANKLSRTLAAALALSLGMSALPMATAAAEYQDFDTVMNTGINLQSEQTLRLARPTADTTVTSANYYMTGASDPTATLTCNGTEVADRGKYGSFGLYLTLEMGENTFKLVNGDKSKTVTITRGKTSDSVPTVSKIQVAYPNYDDLANAGEAYKLRCTAPANGEVTAELGGKQIPLKQEVAATTGVEAYYSADIIMPIVDKTELKSGGKVTFNLNYNGKTSSKTSTGEVYISGRDASPVVEVSQNAAILYEEGKTASNFVSTISKGAVDRVTDSNSNFYQLGLGAWVSKEYASLQPEGTKYKNKVSDVSYEKLGNAEVMTISGTASASYKAFSNSEKISIKFYNTTGLSAVPSMESKLFSSVQLTEESGTVTLDFVKKHSSSVLGFLVSYDGEGNTEIYFNPTPTSSSGDQPLKGNTIVIDPGHGGYDPGTLGVLGTTGPNEKSFTLSTSLAVKNRLESLGAKVIMTVDKTLSKDNKVQLTDRIRIANESRADFFLSIHCNSIDANGNGLKPSGTEIYYYENNSKLLADSMLSKITTYTERKARGVMYGYYYVTRNPLCASMLIELGFLSNPVEYDNLRDPQTIFKTANAIGDSLVSYLK